MPHRPILEDRPALPHPALETSLGSKVLGCLVWTVCKAYAAESAAGPALPGSAAEPAAVASGGTRMGRAAFLAETADSGDELCATRFVRCDSAYRKSHRVEEEGGQPGIYSPAGSDNDGGSSSSSSSPRCASSATGRADPTADWSDDCAQLAQQVQELQQQLAAERAAAAQQQAVAAAAQQEAAGLRQQLAAAAQHQQQQERDAAAAAAWQAEAQLRELRVQVEQQEQATAAATAEADRLCQQLLNHRRAAAVAAAAARKQQEAAEQRARNAAAALLAAEQQREEAEGARSNTELALLTAERRVHAAEDKARKARGQADRQREVIAMLAGSRSRACDERFSLRDELQQSRADCHAAQRAATHLKEALEQQHAAAAAGAAAAAAEAEQAAARRWHERVADLRKQLAEARRLLHQAQESEAAACQELASDRTLLEEAHEALSVDHAVLSKARDELADELAVLQQKTQRGLRVAAAASGGASSGASIPSSSSPGSSPRAGGASQGASHGSSDRGGGGGGGGSPACPGSPVSPRIGACRPQHHSSP